MNKKTNITKKHLKGIVNEAIGFRIPNYETAAISELDELINVISGPITDLRYDKSFVEGPITNRIFQLVTEGGELHSSIQELIDLLESLEDIKKSQLGFKTGQ